MRTVSELCEALEKGNLFALSGFLFPLRNIARILLITEEGDKNKEEASDSWSARRDYRDQWEKRNNADTYMI